MSVLPSCQITFVTEEKDAITTLTLSLNHTAGCREMGVFPIMQQCETTLLPTSKGY